MKRQVKEIMTRNPKTVKADAPLSDVAKILLEFHISGVPVINDKQELIGIVTEKDLINFIFSGTFFESCVRDAMIKDVVSFEANTPGIEICDFFIKNHIRRIPITEKGKLVGIVSRRDIIKAIPEMYHRSL